MQSDILANKKLITKDGLTFVDLTSASIKYTVEVPIIRAFYCGEDMAMRVDSISLAAYGNIDNYDKICKFNGISNPFAVNIGDLIQVPELGVMNTAMQNPSQDTPAEDVRNQYIDSTKTSTIDPNKLEYDKIIQNAGNLTGVKFSKYNLPPNMAAPGESEAKITDSGVIYLGAYVTKK